mmetsp:Transcript_120466/g.341335  ORF Transcript_120466/g.341335 Transcript_120466/m.341335 type:complete len:249 (-) Transcript_120466:7-753(-)
MPTCVLVSRMLLSTGGKPGTRFRGMPSHSSSLCWRRTFCSCLGSAEPPSPARSSKRLWKRRTDSSQAAWARRMARSTASGLPYGTTSMSSIPMETMASRCFTKTSICSAPFIFAGRGCNTKVHTFSRCRDSSCGIAFLMTACSLAEAEVHSHTRTRWLRCDSSATAAWSKSTRPSVSCLGAKASDGMASLLHTGKRIVHSSLSCAASCGTSASMRRNSSRGAAQPVDGGRQRARQLGRTLCLGTSPVP